MLVGEGEREKRRRGVREDSNQSNRASFDVNLWGQIGTAVGVEGRSFYNEGHAGLTFWAPNLNIFRY